MILNPIFSSSNSSYTHIPPNFSAQSGLTEIKQAVNFDLSSFRGSQSYFMRLENASDMVPWCQIQICKDCFSPVQQSRWSRKALQISHLPWIYFDDDFPDNVWPANVFSWHNPCIIHAWWPTFDQRKRNILPCDPCDIVILWYSFISCRTSIREWAKWSKSCFYHNTTSR